MIVPTLCVGMQPGTLRVPNGMTRSVTAGVTTRSVGTILWRHYRDKLTR